MSGCAVSNMGVFSEDFVHMGRIGESESHHIRAPRPAVRYFAGSQERGSSLYLVSEGFIVSMDVYIYVRK